MTDELLEQNKEEASEKVTNQELAHTPFPVMQELMILAGILFLLLGTSYVDEIIALAKPQDVEGNVTVEETPTPVTTTSNIRTEPVTFDNVFITAKSAYVWDVNTQRALYKKNADEQLPLASVTKLMTALLAYELLDQGSNVEITMNAIAVDGDSGFIDGEEFTIENLLDITLVKSSNDGAAALAEAGGGTLLETKDGVETFVRAMNIRADDIGLSQTYFNNPTGLDISESRAGAYGSARDMAFLMEYILRNYPSILSSTQSESSLIPNTHGETHIVENTNRTVTNIPGLLGSKTGYTALAGGNLVIAFDAGLNHPIIVSVLGSTHQGRFDDVETLVARTKQYILNH